MLIYFMLIIAENAEVSAPPTSWGQANDVT